MKIKYKIFIFLFISCSLFSQERIGEPKNMITSRQASTLQVESMPYDLIIPFIEDNLFGFCVEVYDLTFSGSPDAFGAFDVFSKEPIFDSKLFKLPNFFASSHRASLTSEGIHNMGMAAIDGLLKK